MIPSTFYFQAFKLPKVSIRRDLHHNLVTHVPGFQFPIRREDDLERLEFLVKSNPIVRHQYVSITFHLQSLFSVQYWLVTFDLQVGYLATKKPRTVSIVQCFRMFFADEALRRYNWNGLDSPRYPKRPMKNYDIFTSCMLGMVCCSTRITT